MESPEKVAKTIDFTITVKKNDATGIFPKKKFDRS
jgi:hypothetical protein